ncbi:hypothetical protein N7462_009701 [Penicillium macrosclerotiorum]|uniref:uncharacterized protein n=1 Tax=Penicillium macrosclerotiorum TaxID=303699 RepID=UPI0025480B1A|nr:uncharacterized protein N7462_009701 [Penicillium macrosclerotiorum]KAJ5674262.1 hypothetical protein N7462_009701 [Penicillium macrosclerotiorum]
MAGDKLKILKGKYKDRQRKLDAKSAVPGTEDEREKVRGGEHTRESKVKRTSQEQRRADTNQAGIKHAHRRGALDARPSFHQTIPKALCNNESARYISFRASGARAKLTYRSHRYAQHNPACTT